ncbi:hypothetical protein CEP53_002235 [Fusarium sp. AF-6]|nr:hypothetical protein CEP53_002235 [Fusarium sp. AF-6]
MGDLLPFETNYDVLDLLPEDPNISNQSLLDQCFDLDIGDSANQTLSPAAHGSNPTSDKAVDTSHQLSPLLLSELRHLPSALTDYFFKEVIKLYCTWDNSFNSLRVMIGRMWQSSGTLYHIMQSMAAVCLSESFPHLASTAFGERSCALEYLQQNSVSPICKEEHALATFLFGHSSSWFDPHDLATDKFQEAGALISSWSLPDGEFSWSFLEEALDFWKMLLAFTRHNKWEKPEPTDMRQSFSADWPYIPPCLEWDFSRDSPTDGRCRAIDFFRNTLEEASRLEQQLLAFVAAEASCIVDPGDPSTPPTHFQYMDEAFRYTGL